MPSPSFFLYSEFPPQNTDKNRRAAFTSILETVRSVPFPLPRAFFRTGGGPRIAIVALPPLPPSTSPGTIQEHDWWWMIGGAQDSTDPTSSSYGSSFSHHAKRHKRDAYNTNSNNGNNAVTGVRYYGPSCDLQAQIATAERLRRPPLPLMGGYSSAATAADSAATVATAASTVTIPGETAPHSASPSFLGRRAWLPSEIWWAQVARDEAFSEGEWGAGGGGDGRGAWRCGGRAPHVSAAVADAPGVWLLQGSVCPGKGAGGALPPVSEVCFCLGRADG